MIAMKMSEGGRVVVPVEIRQALGLKEGDTVLWELKDGEALLTTRLQRLQRAQALFQQFFPRDEGHSVVDQFIAERRVEAERE